MTTALSPKIVLPTIALLLWCAILIGVAAQFGLWNLSLAKDSAIWFGVSAIVLLVHAHRVHRETHFVRRAVLETLGLSSLLVFIGDLYALPLIVELILQPVLFLLAGTAIVAEQKSETKIVARILESILAIIGVGFLCYALLRLVGDWGALDWSQLSRELILSIWLTVGVIPSSFS